MFASLFAAAALASTLPSSVLQDLAQVRGDVEQGDAIWPGYASAPFAFLYVAPEQEYLLCDERLPDGFEEAGRDTALDCGISRGPPSWRKPNLLASMPIFGSDEVIVMGSPEATGHSREDWRRTIFHEHFHQWQGDLTAIYARIASLDLADGDETGMWMLQFPFPYANEAVGAAYDNARNALLDALDAPNEKLGAASARYLAARERLAEAAGERNWRYFDFQLWKEGVATWTEFAIAGRIEGGSGENARRLWNDRLEALRMQPLSKVGRNAVYNYGAAEAALLERVDPDWRGCYRVSLGLTDCWASLSLN